MKPIEIDLEREDRYARLRLIPWWDQEKLRQARVMVVGAGAIGNEILKNLALLGVGTILVVDMDRIENSNLSRAVLYRETDEGALKAETAARQVMALNPDVKAIPMTGNIITDVGNGFFRHVDVVLGGLDNREARLAINQKCWKAGTPWIDGAIEVFQGFARVFIPPASACYECTMNETDYRLLNFRKSCSLLTRQEMLSGKVPTTPTTASVIAGIQVQEAVKLIHGDPALRPLSGQGFVFNGLTHDSYTVTYTRREDCFSHENWEPVTERLFTAANTTLAQAVEALQQQLTPKTVLETPQEWVLTGTCLCGGEKSFYRPLIQVAQEEARCSACGDEMSLEMTHRFTGTEVFANETLQALGFAPGEILHGRDGLQNVYIELTGDIQRVFSSPAEFSATEQTGRKCP
ncbi:HesA/MoeB/ThiF family protein [Anoxynatronum buryatiense]|uniref:Adenylyltransferase and sulfurtransferase n=1 Tax=Anoxynatronum buryatiense TaxID=489973 RepID=A0AA46AKF0_9CLOT|nr:ThiF family adenylyltransferase [Anoxynatronum buryatiense]SMP69148.1 adenylyltransferase and sulfurtransferase [Anoxynatronum buryatiense]